MKVTLSPPNYYSPFTIRDIETPSTSIIIHQFLNKVHLKSFDIPSSNNEILISVLSLVEQLTILKIIYLTIILFNKYQHHLNVTRDL